MRFRIVEEPEGSPLRFGKGLPLSTSDLGADWGGTDLWVRAQAASIAKAIILHKYWRNKLSVSFSGMPSSFELDLTKWNEGHRKETDEVNRAESQRERDIRPQGRSWRREECHDYEAVAGPSVKVSRRVRGREGFAEMQ